ncbi:acyl carrier protein [Alkalilimnicola sp. S0819]|uniref:acyl carrier protein n=1 Tax=Alkalilimnicola sp. S0819 TaxID=2613922 RepID=UPI001261A506|nr:acyl carrier protein [Alkalilimnicola sp. S0819]KAB7619600.1 acyl carrier protein [Alkalilimnicola sp. S0819]MPQ17604.1 acyl carrier protein [Alkalilimnicola sp. S0819]
MNSEQIFDLLVREIRAVLPELEDHPIGRDDAMADLGVDSIERKDVIVATLEALDLRIPLVQVHGPRNLGELADLLHARLAA